MRRVPIEILSLVVTDFHQFVSVVKQQASAVNITKCSRVCIREKQDSEDLVRTDHVDYFIKE